MKSYVQQSSVQQFLAANRSSPRISALSLLLAVILMFIPLQSYAGAATNQQFRNYIVGICAATITAPPGVVWDAATLNTMCTNSASVISGASTAVSPNLGTADAANGAASAKNKDLHECLDEPKSAQEKKNCATGGWGLLLSTQYGHSNRSETELENGFQSDLRGLLIGLDHRFSDNFIIGTAVSHTQDEAVFINGAGSLRSRNSTISMYSTWLPSERISVDGYIGYGAINYDGQRQVVFGTLISGTATGNTTGRQTMAGLSSTYQGNLAKTSISPFINLDYIKTDIRGYNETGNTLLEIHYGDRSTISSTVSLGVKLSQSYGFQWGSLSPSLHGSGVHEFQNNASIINTELVLTPGAGILVATDEPDRDYFLSGFGFVAALNSGTQLFMNYEKRSGDSYLDSWVVSLGLVKEF